MAEAPNICAKQCILAHYSVGIRDIEKIAVLTQSSPHDVHSILQDEGYLPADCCHDGFNSEDLDVYSAHFRGKIGFKNLEVARASVEILRDCYLQLETKADRIGQHHVLIEALTLFNKARWADKAMEAEVFARFIKSILRTSIPPQSAH